MLKYHLRKSAKRSALRTELKKKKGWYFELCCKSKNKWISKFDYLELRVWETKHSKFLEIVRYNSSCKRLSFEYGFLCYFYFWSVKWKMTTHKIKFIWLLEIILWSSNTCFLPQKDYFTKAKKERTNSIIGANLSYFLMCYVLLCNNCGTL